MARNTCTIYGCEGMAHGRGWCSKHYVRWLRHGDPMRVTPPTARVCEKTPKATVTPTARDIAWAAGFLEGEGHFRRKGVGAGVTAKQVQREPLERLQRYFGGHIDYRDNQYNGMYNWRVTGSRARGVMGTLYALMSPRRQARIREALWP